MDRKQNDGAPAGKLVLRINGKDKEVDGPLHIRALLDSLGLPQTGVAVERNRLIVPRTEHPETYLADGDELEIVTLVGGG